MELVQVGGGLIQVEKGGLVQVCVGEGRVWLRSVSGWFSGGFRWELEWLFRWVGSGGGRGIGAKVVVKS